MNIPLLRNTLEGCIKLLIPSPDCTSKPQHPPSPPRKDAVYLATQSRAHQTMCGCNHTATHSSFTGSDERCVQPADTRVRWDRENRTHRTNSKGHTHKVQEQPQTHSCTRHQTSSSYVSTSEALGSLHPHTGTYAAAQSHTIRHQQSAQLSTITQELPRPTASHT